MVPNAGNAKVVAAALAERAEDFDVTVQDASAETSLIAVQGPKAQEILLRLVPAAQHELVTGLKYYAAVEVPFMFGGASQELLLARTGYTGEDGFEIFVANDDAAALWQALVAIAEDGELTPAGLASRDSLRLEAGMPLYGNELSLEGDPYAAGLGPIVALSKEGDFVGKAALAAKKEAGAGATTGRKLVGLKGLGRRAGRGHYPVLKDGNVVGEVTSGQPSPAWATRSRWPTSTSSSPNPAPPWTSTSAARPSRSKLWHCLSTSAKSSPAEYLGAVDLAPGRVGLRSRHPLHAWPADARWPRTCSVPKGPTPAGFPGRACAVRRREHAAGCRARRGPAAHPRFNSPLGQRTTTGPTGTGAFESQRCWGMNHLAEGAAHRRFRTATVPFRNWRTVSETVGPEN